jgi:GntR family transcriptional repressor for pyruvate dehydrogenase complex
MSKRKKLSQEVVDNIIEMIRVGDVKVGDQIPTESELAEILQLSRTSVREGIKHLVGIGVLETRQGLGTYVTSSQPGPLLYSKGAFGPQYLELIRDLLEFRKLIEPIMTALATQRCSHNDLIELERCVIELERSIGSGNRPEEDLGFHLAIARATKNSAFVDMSAMIVRFYKYDPSLPSCEDVEEHRAIYQAIQKKDPVAASSRMEAHIENLVQRYRENGYI